jgi:hypothetical protein
MKPHTKLLALTGLFTLTALALPAQPNKFPSSGNVGLGAIKPGEKLVIVSNEIKVRFAGNAGNNASGRIQFYETADGGNLGFGVHGPSGEGWRWQFVDAGNNEYFKVNYPTGNATLFGKVFILNGNNSIDTTQLTHALTVNGAIRAKEVIVDTGWADDVFFPDYKLLSLAETETYIQDNGRLPGIPSAREVQENGASIGETQTMLLRKIEELTLHMIRMEKRVAELEAENAALKK